MQESISLMEILGADNYYLMTNEEGKEVYDDDNNLLLYQSESGSCVSVPNTEDVRRLYDLPLITPEKKDTIKRDDVSKPGSLVCIPNETNRIVWVGQKNNHSIKATKKLIELFDSPKYQTLMKNPNTIKLKVWEKIASELEESGFKIATNSREAGLRTFQKWRNMERTYWKFTKINPDECGEDKRRKKPYFFDDLHVVISKRAKESLLESNSAYSSEGVNYKQEDDDDEDEEVDISHRPEGELKRKRISDLYGTDCEAFPRQALSLLTSLVTSPKYDEYLKDQSHKLHQNKTKIWESIYMDMMKEGWKFGTSIREGALILSEKWRMVEKTILRKKLCGPRTLYTPTLRKAVLSEIEKRKALGPNYTSDSQSPSEFLNPSIRRPKNGEIEPEAIGALLKVVGSGHYQNLFATSGGKRAKIWEKIFEEIQSQGFEIAGATKREKVARLFQKWRNMKRALVKYQVAKFKGREVKKPMFYELMFDIISKDVLNMCNSECDSDEDEVRIDEWDGDSESEYPPEFLEFTQVDHDYEPNGANSAVEMKALPSNMDTELRDSGGTGGTPVKHSVPPPPQPKPSTSRTSRSHQVLKQIKSLHEASLAMQQQNFTKIISLLENQVSEQNRLTTAISEYIKSQTVKSSSKHGHRTQQFNNNKTNNEKKSNAFKDDNFLS